MAGRASIVGAAATHIGKVREHNEDAHFFDSDAGVFLVCDGMGGHAAGEVASALAIQTIRENWSDEATRMLADAWLASGEPEAKKQLLSGIRAGALAAHDAILDEASQDDAKTGMGTTLVGAVIVGNELVFAHAGDSRAYLVRDGIAMQLTEDHTLLARLLAAGIDVDVSGEGARFRSMLTNALGIGNECRVSVFVVPLADGDRFLLCSDGVSEYVKEAEVGEVLTKQPSPARAAQRLIDLALDRGGGDNATAIVVRVLEAGETPQPAAWIKREDEIIASCPVWGDRVTPQQRLRALRIAIPRDHAIGTRIPANTLGDRVAWILVEGKLLLDGALLGPGEIIYPESLVADTHAPDREGLAVARTDVRLLALRADDFRELCEDDSELGEALLEALAPLVARRRDRPVRDRADTEIDTETQAAIANAHPRDGAIEMEVDEPDPDDHEPLPEIVPAPAMVRLQTAPGVQPASATGPQPAITEPVVARTSTGPRTVPPGPPPGKRITTPPGTPVIATIPDDRVRKATPPGTPPIQRKTAPGPVPVAIAPEERIRKATPPGTATVRIPTDERLRKATPLGVLPIPHPAAIDEALAAARVELDARFDAVFATPQAGLPIVVPKHPEEPAARVPLILKPRPATDPGNVKIPLPMSRAKSDPAIAQARAESSPGAISSYQRPARPPSEPEIVTEIEMEADEPPDNAVAVALAEDDEPEVTVVVVDDQTEDPADGGIEVHLSPERVEESAPLLIHDTPPDKIDDEPTDIRKAVPNEPKKSVTTITINNGDGLPKRTKRLSDGWDD
ncbi:MAG: protein phosphatase 2C domain-containing protein [Kofleriaceae bacterium]